jgi:maltose-binding protein MalE
MFYAPLLCPVVMAAAARQNPVSQRAIEQAKYSIPMPLDSRLRFIWDGRREPYRRVFTDNLSPDDAARLMPREAERRITEGPQ